VLVVYYLVLCSGVSFCSDIHNVLIKSIIMFITSYLKVYVASECNQVCTLCAIFWTTDYYDIGGFYHLKGFFSWLYSVSIGGRRKVKIKSRRTYCWLNTYSPWLTLRCSYGTILCHFRELLCCQILQATHQTSSQLTSEDHLWWQSMCGTWHSLTSHPGPLNHQSASKHMVSSYTSLHSSSVHYKATGETSTDTKYEKFVLLPS
jgi:hypothetical protein